nr:MAG TPA: hypothetical protein [Caudoviricetes sp.]
MCATCGSHTDWHISVLLRLGTPCVSSVWSLWSQVSLERKRPILKVIIEA